MTIFKNDFLVIKLLRNATNKACISKDASLPKDTTCYNIVANGTIAGRVLYNIHGSMVFFAVEDVAHRDIIVAALPVQIN